MNQILFLWTELTYGEITGKLYQKNKIQAIFLLALLHLIILAALLGSGTWWGLCCWTVSALFLVWNVLLDPRTAGLAEKLEKIESSAGQMPTSKGIKTLFLRNLRIYIPVLLSIAVCMILICAAVIQKRGGLFIAFSRANTPVVENQTANDSQKNAPKPENSNVSQDDANKTDGKNPAVPKVPDNSEELKKAATHYERFVALKSEDPFQALEELSNAIALVPQNSNWYCERGTLYRDIRLYDHGLEDLTKAIQISPNMAPAYQIRGDIYYRKKQYDKAVTDWQKAIQLDSSLSEKLEPMISKAQAGGKN